jgi:hypothetical protein
VDLKIWAAIIGDATRAGSTYDHLFDARAPTAGIEKTVRGIETAFGSLIEKIEGHVTAHINQKLTSE